MSWPAKVWAGYLVPPRVFEALALNPVEARRMAYMVPLPRQWARLEFGRGPARRLARGKIMTSRRGFVARPGDRFVNRRRTFEVLAVCRLRVSDIADKYYRHEGYDSPAEYLGDIVKFYPDVRYDERLFVYLFYEVKLVQKTLGDEV